MEKLIYPMWKPATSSANDFRDSLIDIAAALLTENVNHMRICVVDDDVAPAAQYRIESTRPAVDAVMFLWVDSAVFRAPLESIISKAVARYCGYLATESEPLVNAKPAAVTGERTPGMNEIVFLTRPPRLGREQWLDIWLNSHTQVAIDTQSTFGYRQNVIVRALTYAAPLYDAIIEENFPAAALRSREEFYAAGKDTALYREREKIMVESCARFIDFDKIDCIPMSEYVFR